MPDAPPAPIEVLADGKPFATSDAYSHLLFHGPRFQLASSIPAVAVGGIDAIVKPCQPRDWLAEASGGWLFDPGLVDRSEEHTSELQSLMRISYAVFCLK